MTKPKKPRVVPHAFVIYQACGCHAAWMFTDSAKPGPRDTKFVLQALRENRRVAHVPASPLNLHFGPDCGRREHANALPMSLSTAVGPPSSPQMTPGWYEVRDGDRDAMPTVRAWSRRGGWYSPLEVGWLIDPRELAIVRRLGDLEPEDTQLSPVEQMERAVRRAGRGVQEAA